jgi:hypothetical protein
VAGPGLAGKAKGEFKFASAAAAGSAESVNSILRTRYAEGMAKPDNAVAAAKTTARNTSEQLKQGREMIEALRKLATLTPYELVSDLGG